MGSIWTESWQIRNFPTQCKDIHTDVLIIGGGIAGILCAYQLHQAGVDYVLAEAKTICNGITKDTTAKITAQHGLIFDQMIRRFGLEKTSQYLLANEAALAQYRVLCDKIDCDYEEKDAFVYSLNSVDPIKNEFLALKRLGISAIYRESLPIPLPVAAAVGFSKQAQFHPLKFLSAISNTLNILEHTTVRELIGLDAVTDHGKIHAKKIIVATHFPFLNKHGLYPAKLYQHRSYVIALEHSKGIPGMYVDAEQTGMSFRCYNELLLIGGGSHRTGKKGGAWRELLDFAHCHYPNAKIVHQWATQDCMSLDSIPYVGPYSGRTEGLYVATGFNKWGMTNAMAASMILCDLVQGKENPFASVFSPSRSMLHPQLAVNGFETLTNLLTPTTKRCPHLGCALKWNNNEHTWDCPCHGSRFAEDGKCIDNPATGDTSF